jgi:hypothetical protein
MLVGTYLGRFRDHIVLDADVVSGRRFRARATMSGRGVDVSLRLAAANRSERRSRRLDAHRRGKGVRMSPM